MSYYGSYDLWKLAGPEEQEEDTAVEFPAFGVVIRGKLWASTYPTIERAEEEWRGFACNPCLSVREPKNQGRCCYVLDV